MDHEFVVSVGDRVSGEFCDKTCHGHLDVKFHHIGYRVELDVDDLILE